MNTSAIIGINRRGGYCEPLVRTATEYWTKLEIGQFRFEAERTIRRRFHWVFWVLPRSPQRALVVQSLSQPAGMFAKLDRGGSTTSSQ